MRHGGGDLAQHVGHVGIGDGQRDSADSRAIDTFGEVDRVGDVAVLQVVAQLVGHHDGAVVLGLARAGAQVRQRDDTGVAQQRRAGEIADVAAELPGIERAEHGGFVDHAFAREIEQHRVRAQQADVRLR